MKTYYFADFQGNVFKTTSVFPFIPGNSYDLGLCIGIDLSIQETELVYFKNSELLPRVNKPSNYHTWNLATASWEIQNETVVLVKLERLQALEITRQNLSLQPVSYDNKTLDTDTQAQANINGKLQEIFAREAVGTPLTSGQMFWKDADNIVHEWTDQTTYKLWLQGLVIAISSRNTALYAAAWAKKAELEALTDINDIVNYDVSVGWTI